MRSIFASFVIAAAAMLASALPASAAFPEGQVRLIVPFTAGTGPDVLARSVAQELSSIWSKPVVVINRPGSNGVLAIDLFRKSPPDRRTLVMIDSTFLTINPYLYAKIAYDPAADFVPIAALASTPFNLIVKATWPIQSLKELIAYAKAHPGKLAYGSSTGIGHPGHLGMEEFKKLTGTEMTLIPYLSSQPMLADLATGRLQLAWASYATARAFIQNGTVRGLASGTRTRQAELPNVPTVEEAGGPANFVVNRWLALYGAPALTPETARQIAADAGKALQAPAVVEKIRSLSYEPLAGTGKDIDAWVRADSERFAPPIRELKIKLE